MKELRLIRVVYVPKSGLRSEAIRGWTHHHLVCQRCGTLLHLQEALQEELRVLVQGCYHFHEVTLDVLSTGYCEPCWQTLSCEALTASMDECNRGDDSSPKEKESLSI